MSGPPHFPAHADPRRTRVLVHVDDVVETDLLERLARRFAGERSLLLTIGAPGWTPESLGSALAPLAEAADLDADDAIEVIAQPIADEPTFTAIARGQDALLARDGAPSPVAEVAALLEAKAAAVLRLVGRPRISLAMPSYGQGRYVARAIASVLSQDFAAWELLVHDACSTDETGAILAEAAALDPRVKVVVEPDGGQSDAINRAFRRARGDILGWLNADDELEPGALARVVSALDASDCDLLYGQGDYVDEDGEPIRPFNVLPFDRELLKTTDYILQPASFWRRSLWERVGELDTRLHYAFDWEWFARASRRTDFLLVDDRLARYRLTGDNKSLTGDTRRERELATVARRNGGVRQPTFLYWTARQLGRRCRHADAYADRLWAEHAARICT